MKMKQLEDRTGVGRETIRYYIREGLLPEPERPKPNVAHYSEAHVRRILTIKRLQQERFLPLSVIKSILAADPGALSEAVDGIPHLEHLLAERMALLDTGDGILAGDAAKAAGIPAAEISELAAVGAISLVPTPAGPSVRGVDAVIVGLWGQLRQIGISAENGYTPQDMKLYVDFARAMAETEIRLFFDRIGSRHTPEEAAQIAQQAIEVSNRIFGLFRAKAVVAAAEALNAEAAN